MPGPYDQAGARVAVGSVTRPADTAIYAIGDLIANNVTAGAVAPITLNTSNKGGVAGRLRLKVNDTAWKAGVIRCHLFRNQPAVAVGDNGVLNASETYAFTESDYLGFADVTLAQQTSDGFVKGLAAFPFTFDVGGAGLFALLEARTAVTPASGKIFTVALEVAGDQ